MRAFAWLRARPRAIASASAVTASAVALTTMAFLYDGFPTTEVDLHDGGVWVTKQSSLLVGHFNYESRVLDGGLRTASEEYDILQSGDDIVVVDQAASSVTAIDPAMVTMTDSADVPGGAAVALGGTTVAILDPESGALWALPADGVGGFDIEGTEPVDTLGAGAALAVGTDGTVYAASSEQKELVTVPAVPDGSFGEPQRTELGDIADGAELAVTAVGGTAVVLDRTGGTLVSTGGLRADIADAETARLQQPSGASDAVAVATASTLVRAPLDGSEPVVVDAGAEGAPAEPVSLAGCTYGVWSGSASFIRDCIGEADDLATTVEGVDDDAELVFRVNRDVIVLNDIRGGSAWMAADDLQQVDNWDDITPPEGEAEENDEETTDETVETTLPERTDKNTVPEAVDDDFGVRPGRTTVLPVLDNDTDADGDILTVTLPDGGPSLGEVQTINNGAGLQIAVPESANGSARFPYRIDDGRGGSDTATVTLSVRPDTVNGAPSQKRTTSLQVEAGGVVTHNVLPDWIDPDGDDIFLSGVEAEPGDEVDFTPDGRITYRSINGVQGRKDIAITVSDTQKSTAGILRLDVRPVGSTSPVTNADHVVTRAGVPVEVSPLLNDLSTGREPLRLTRVDEVPGAAVVPDFSDSTFTFTSNAVGTYYVQYLASAGAKNALGVVRVDVLEDADEDAAPVAVRDVALLPSGGEVLVAALANDIDPAGGILVIQSVSIESDSGVSVSVLGHETLRVSDQGALSTQVTVKYTISNGIRSAEGEVVVIPVPGPEKLRPPVADDDKAVVRAGDVVTIPVLDNDYHPNGDTIHVAPDLVEPLPAADAGDIFVSQDTIRFKAGPEAGTVYATYEVVDSTGQKDAGYVTIQVLPVDEETNQTPRPRDVTARVLAGSQVRIPIPLDGIDADGDSVDLVGLASAPEKGRVVETGATYLEYQADVEASGTDTFTYRVRDRLGAESTATIRVGIAPPEARNQAPYAVKDTVVMRPGRSVAVPVLTNDSDPEGDAIGLVAGGLILPDVPGLEAEVLGDRVIVTSPDEELETSLQYTIRDARGAEAIAVLQVTVDEDVPLLRPIARDDRVLPEDVDGPTVDLEVLANDEDPDGTVAALTVEVDDPVAQARPDGTVRITLDDEEHLVTYTITDEDGQIASAFIRVPSLDDLPPTLITTTGIEVDSGETVEIPLSEHVRAAGDRDVVITEAAKVSAVHSNGAELVKDQRTLVYTSADGYYGQDAITFEVTDGTGPDDPEGRKATLTMPVTVRPPANQQPTFVDGEMNVAPGEDATGLDLRSLTTDPDEGDIDGMSYTVVGGAPAGLTASIEDGSTLRVGAAADTPKGTQATVGLRITDGETDPIEGTVVVTVTASTRPLATANDDVLPRVDQGSTVEVPVLDNDFNPFPETPLTLVSAVTQTGDGRAEVSGDRVAVSPSASFVGTMVVRYRVQDATGDPDREVEGLITITVQGRPDAPGTPTVSSVQDRTVVLAWTPPVDNGSPITGYTVSSTRGDYVKQCASTTCTLDGLTNNVEYNFTVVAANAVGESDPSPPSETARPDARPDTPQPPTLTFGDQSLNVAWQTPTTPGSPVETFTLEISPAPPSGVSQKTNVTGNTLVWEGLENGASYQVRVRAHNRAPEPSSWSGWSASEVPARAPEPVAAPSTQRLEPVGEQAQMQVSWSPPANNGAAISVYQLQVLRGGAVVNTIETSATSQAVVIETSTTDYTFRVRANNKAGWGEYGPNSAPRRAFVAPDAPTNVSARPGDRSLQMSFTEPDGNGATQSEMRYEYSLNGGNWQALAGNRLITGLNNGTDYQVRIRAYTALDGVRYNGAPSAPSAAQRPYGPVGTPSADASRSGRDITFSWGAPAPNGRAIQQVQIRIDGGGWQDVAKNGSRTNTYAYSTTHRIDVRAFDTEGQVSPIASAQATTVDEPRAVARTGKGSSVSRSDCTSASCAYLTLTVENFPAGSYNLSCEREGRTFVAARSYNVPRNGTIQLGCYFGYPGEQVWVRIHGWGDAQRITW